MMFGNRVPHMLSGDYTRSRPSTSSQGSRPRSRSGATALPLPLAAAAHQLFLMAAASAMAARTTRSGQLRDAGRDQRQRQALAAPVQGGKDMTGFMAGARSIRHLLAALVLGWFAIPRAPPVGARPVDLQLSSRRCLGQRRCDALECRSAAMRRPSPIRRVQSRGWTSDQACHRSGDGCTWSGADRPDRGRAYAGFA